MGLVSVWLDRKEIQEEKTYIERTSMINNARQLQDELFPIEKNGNSLDPNSQTPSITRGSKPLLVNKSLRSLSSNTISKNQKRLLQHGSVYINLLDIVLQEALKSENANHKDGEDLQTPEIQAPQHLLRKIKQSKSVRFTEQKLLFLKRRETCELPEEKLTQCVKRKLNLIQFVRDQEEKDQEITSSKLNFSFQHLFFSEHRLITGSKKVRRHISKVRKGVEYSLRSLQGNSFKHIEGKVSYSKDIPPLCKEKTRTLVLDLDGTIVWTNLKMDNPDFILETQNSKGGRSKLCVKIRPFLKEMLEVLSRVYEIMIFTASSKEYAEELLKLIDPERQYISSLFTRQDCLQTKNGFFIKDLKILHRELSRIVIVDNLVHSFGLQLDNGIPILDYEGERHDEELYYLTEYLLKLSRSSDQEFIQNNKNYFKLQKILKVNLNQM